jgi:hypothetical protein
MKLELHIVTCGAWVAVIYAIFFQIKMYASKWNPFFGYKQCNVLAHFSVPLPFEVNHNLDREAVTEPSDSLLLQFWYQRKSQPHTHAEPPMFTTMTKFYEPSKASPFLLHPDNPIKGYQFICCNKSVNNLPLPHSQPLHHLIKFHGPF